MASSRRWLTLTAFVALIAGAGGVSAGILITSPPPGLAEFAIRPIDVPRHHPRVHRYALPHPHDSPGLASRTHLPHLRAHHGPPGSTGNSRHVRFSPLRD